MNQLSVTHSRIRIRKGDTVRIIAGKDKGKSGKVLEVNPRAGRILIEKLNIIKRHMKPSQKNRQGGIIDREAPLQVSNVMVVCENCGKASRMGMRRLEDGEKMRYCKKCGDIMGRK